MSEFIVEVSRHNPALARSLRALRKRAESAVRDAAIADTLLDAREATAGSESPSVTDANGLASSPSLSDGALPDASASLDSLADNPLRTLRALDFTTITPLAELDALTLRARRVLQRRRSRLRVTLLVGGLLAGILLGVSIYSLMTGGYISGGLVLVVTLAIIAGAQSLWRPFERASRTQRLSQLASDMAEDIAGRVRSLEQIPDASARQLTQWKAVIDLTEAIS